MTAGVITKIVDLPAIDKNSVIHYMRSSTTDEFAVKIFDDCNLEFKRVTSGTGKICYCRTPLKIDAGEVDFGFFSTHSLSLAKHLKNCTEAIIFASTAGIEFDRLIEKYKIVSPAKAFCFDSIGAERVECLCDIFCESFKTDYPDLSFTSRFSPGYGDLSIKTQKEIFSLLDCPRKIGLSLSDGFMMTPSKSVSAIIGLKEKE